MTSTPNVTSYKMFQQVEKVILKEGGVIFGGYPRDKIQHDHFAQLFYKTPDVDVTRYSDPSYLPEYEGRLKLPTDIDVYFSTSYQINAFKNALCSIQMRVVCEMPGKGIYMLPKGMSHTIMIVKNNINAVIADTVPSLANLHVKIDVITSETKMCPPFGMLDFQCNGILLHGNSEYTLSPIVAPFSMCPLVKINKLQQIVSDIVIGKAILHDKSVQKYRIEKMLLKGWTVQGDRLQAGLQTPDDVCMLCLEEFSSPDTINNNACINKHIKVTCCNSFFHPKCMMKLINNKIESCPNCRKELW